MSGTNGSHAPPDRSDDVSARVVDQRCRNRLIEIVETFAEGPNGPVMRAIGPGDPIQDFFMYVSDDCIPQSNSALSAEETLEAIALCEVISKALDASSRPLDDTEFIEAGWADEIMPIAQRVLEVFLRRGRFDEEKEEAEPSG